jgi:hypothetical protein
MAFRIGQKVQCIAGRAGWYRPGSATPEPGPMRGQVLRISGFDFISSACETYLAFAEFPAGTYFSHSFRPLVRKKTDISVFQAMLTPAPKQRARARRKVVDHV